MTLVLHICVSWTLLGPEVPSVRRAVLMKTYLNLYVGKGSPDIHYIKMSVLTYHITARAIFDILPFTRPEEEEEENMWVKWLWEWMIKQTTMHSNHPGLKLLVYFILPALELPSSDSVATHKHESVVCLQIFNIQIHTMCTKQGSGFTGRQSAI